MFNLKNRLCFDMTVQGIVDFYADAIVLPSSTALDSGVGSMVQIGKRAGRSRRRES